MIAIATALILAMPAGDAVCQGIATAARRQAPQTVMPVVHIDGARPDCRRWITLDLFRERSDRPPSLGDRWLLRRQRPDGRGGIAVDWIDSARCTGFGAVLAIGNKLPKAGAAPDDSRPPPVQHYTFSRSRPAVSGDDRDDRTSPDPAALGRWVEYDLVAVDSCWRAGEP